MNNNNQSSPSSFVSPRGKRNLNQIFQLLDVAGYGKLSKASILKAIHNDQRVIQLMGESNSLRPFLVPRLYTDAFSRMNTSNSGLVTIDEFKTFIEIQREEMQNEFGMEEGKRSDYNNNSNNNIDEEDETLRIIFNMMDLNNDGNISKKEILKSIRTNFELTNLLKTHPKLNILLRPREWENAFMKMDTSEDNLVNYYEFQAFSSILAASKANEGQNTNNNNNKTFDEDKIKKIASEIFIMLDSDNDGNLTKREIMKGIRKKQVKAFIQKYPFLDVLTKPNKWKHAFNAMDT